MRNELEYQANQLGISENIRFLGIRRDVRQILAILDLLVLPSLNEGMGRVLIEAQAAAKPVVATSVGGIPEVIINGKTGLLVPPKDPIALADAIIGLLCDREKAKRMGRAGKKGMNPDFGVEVMVERISHLYEKMIVEKRINGRSNRKWMDF